MPLTLHDIGATCPTGHSFDRGRGGYLNLLIGGRLGSRASAGDTPDSLAARRRFLRGGHYAPIAQAVAAAVGTPDGPVLDIGCGEGYYLSQLAPATEPHRYGLDVSKTAVQMAARAHPHTQFVVGTAYHLPVLDHSVAVVVSVFAPHPADEFARVLRPGGRWVTATPGPNHLRELRPDLRDRELVGARLERRAEPPAGAADAVHLEFELHLDAAAASDLHHMTPIRWQKGATLTDDDRTEPVTVTVDVWVASGA